MTSEQLGRSSSRVSPAHQAGGREHLPAELIQHFEAVYEHKSVFNEEAIMDELPAHIRSRVVKVMYEDMIDNSMFFDGFELYNEAAIMKICLKLKATVALDHAAQ